MNDPVDLDAVISQLQHVPFHYDQSRWRIEAEATELTLEASRDGLIELALHLLTLANSSAPPKIALPWNAGNDEDEFQLSFLQRLDAPETAEDKPASNARVRDRIALWGCGLVAFILAMVFVGGTIFWSQLIWGDL